MKAPCRFSRNLTLVMAMLCTLSPLTAGTTPIEDRARQVLDATNIEGGLVIHIGCGDGRLTAALCAGDSYLVHGLDTDAQNVEQAREHVKSLGLYGKVAVDQLENDRLPYIDNLANLVVSQDPSNISIGEIMRVLCPEGVAYIRKDGKWNKVVKPRSSQIDEWTHYLHGPDNNAVAHDSEVASPFHAQWIGDPKWARHHNYLASTSAMVSSGGRLFAIVDEGPNASLAQPPRWQLVARDAFNGVILWKKSIGPWEGILRPFRSGPTELARRLVAIGDTVYVTLGYDKPVTALNAATGEVVRTYTGTEEAVEIICDGGVLYLVAGTINPDEYAEARRQEKASPVPLSKHILAIEGDTGDVIWKKSNEDTYDLLPTTLCVRGKLVFFQSTSDVICLDARTGQVVWKAARPIRRNRFTWSTPTLVVHEDVVLSADCSAQVSAADSKATTTWNVTAGTAAKEAALGELIAFSKKDGTELWRCKTALGYNSPVDVFIANGLVWAGYTPGHNAIDFAEGRDPYTGEVKQRIETDAAFTETHHHRCYRNKATDRFILLGRAGVELIDLSGADPLRHCWIRGGCQYGVMPANGLLYLPAHSCACYIQSKLSGFWAVAPKRQKPEITDSDSTRLLRGPAYEQIGNRNSKIENPHDWPTYRYDGGRTGRTQSAVPARLEPLWQAEPGGRLTSPVVGSGTLLAAAIDEHTVHALDSESGRELWQYTAGGRIDSPPTIHEGKAVFGCADGNVHCLRLADGKLIWRFRAAPTDRRTVASGQVESLWPVTGSVLVYDDVVYCTAGRTSYLDGGMYLYRLDSTTGALLGRTRFYDRDPVTGEQPEAIIEDVELPGALPDVLVCDGQNIYLRDKVLDFDGKQQDSYVPHLYCSAGLLDDTWWHRTYWLWGERTWGRASGWHVIPGLRPSGRILVTDEKTVFGYGRKNVRTSNLQGYHLFRADKQVTDGNRQIKNNNKALVKYQKPAKVRYHWSRDVPVVVRAMVLTKDVLFTAGPVMAQNDDTAAEPVFDRAGSAVIMAFDAEDGRTLSRCQLGAQPVFDGMAAANGKLYVSTLDGKIACLGKK